MTVEVQSSAVSYVVTNPAIGTEYPITFPYIETTDIKAYYLRVVNNLNVRTEMTYGTDYSVVAQTFITNIVIPLEGDTKLAIYRDTERSQEILWVDGQAVYPPSIMKADDKLTFIVQELTDQVNLAIRTSITDDQPALTTQELYDNLNTIANRAEEAVTQAEGVLETAEEARDRAEAAATVAGERADEIHNLSIAVDDLPYGEIGYGNYNPYSGMLTLSVPRGRTGMDSTVAGPQGADGAIGPTGDTGPQGDPGTISGELNGLAFGNFRVVPETGILQFAFIGTGEAPEMSINANGQVEVVIP